jgi:hypothetical protein
MVTDHETPTEKVDEVKPKAKVDENFIVALDGDNYQTIADRLGKGFTAESVWIANNEAPVYPGALVRIK